MKELMAIFSSDGKMVRRYVFLSIGLVAFTFVAAQSLVALITFVLPDQSQKFSANSVPASTGTRTYTVTRSVLDDEVTTGSISRPGAVRIDPCKN